MSSQFMQPWSKLVWLEDSDNAWSWAYSQLGKGKRRTIGFYVDFDEMSQAHERGYFDKV
jgi:hypothetical protein